MLILRETADLQLQSWAFGVNHQQFENVVEENAWAEEFGTLEGMGSENKVGKKVGRSPKGAAEESC